MSRFRADSHLTPRKRCESAQRNAGAASMRIQWPSTYATAQVVGFDATVVREFDNLRAKKVRIATMDLRIAAIALSQGMTVLTRNVRDFNQVPGLKVEDWTI